MKTPEEESEAAGGLRMKQKGGESPLPGQGGVVELDTLRRLLSEQAAMILESQRIAVDNAVSALEQRQSERFNAVDCLSLMRLFLSWPWMTSWMRSHGRRGRGGPLLWLSSRHGRVKVRRTSSSA